MGEGSRQATKARSQEAAAVPSAFHRLLEGVSGGFCQRLISPCQQPMPETLQAHSGGFKGPQRGPGGQTQPIAGLPGSVSWWGQDSREQDWRRKSWILPASGFMSRARGESLLGFCSDALFYPQMLSLCGFFGDHSEEFLFSLQAYRPISAFMRVLFTRHLGNQCISK